MATMDCMYCGDRFTTTRRGEHVVPAALGAARTIKQVCPKCNNSFSQIDEELAYRSPLSIVRARVLNEPIRYVWVTASPDSHLLVEASANSGLTDFPTWPQVMLNGDELSVYGDHEDLSELSIGRFTDILLRHAKEAVRSWRSTDRRKRLHLERVSSVFEGYRLPPRIFVRRRIWELNERSNFQARFLHQNDFQRLIAAIEAAPRFTNLRPKSTSVRPTNRVSIKIYSHPISVLRALVKIGLNLIEYLGGYGNVSPKSFPAAIRFVRERNLNPPQSMIDRCGFVEPSGGACCARSGCHTFRLEHSDGKWRVLGSWFGGDAATYVSFPGPRIKSWRSAFVQIPLQSMEWATSQGALILPLKLSASRDLARILPNVPIISSASTDAYADDHKSPHQSRNLAVATKITAPDDYMATPQSD